VCLDAYARGEIFCRVCRVDASVFAVVSAREPREEIHSLETDVALKNR
jgi:hypothetical protein